MTSNLTSVRRRLAENLKRVRERIAQACARARRDPSEITLVAVTKQVDVEAIRHTLDMGLVQLGESRAQQLGQRAAMLYEYVNRHHLLAGPGEKPLPRAHWHMIGHLQRNKIRLVLPWVDLIHSVDSLRLAEDISQQADKLGRDAHVLLQVNTSGERSKFGVAVGAVPYMIEHLAGMPRLKLRGLMTMAPLDASPDEIRLYFERLRELAADLRGEGRAGREFDQLSMGMSNDYPIAIEAGATLIRLGTALYEGCTAATLPATAEDDP